MVSWCVQIHSDIMPAMSEDKPKQSKIEALKEESAYLKGSIPESVAGPGTHFTPDENQLLKYHGAYQQDDRDVRLTLAREKKEKAYSLMLRTRLPGGFLTAEQYLVIDEIADRFGPGHYRITDRQALQFHGILKKDIKTTIQALNNKLITTLGACGDVVRNVMASPAPFEAYEKLGLIDIARDISDLFLPQAGTYHEIWLDGEKVDLGKTPETLEPIYGKFYLPRKFKIAIATPEDNSVDVYTQDVGLVADVSGDALVGFNVLVGGGMGMTHGIETTFPRVASPFAYVAVEDLKEFVKAIVITQRDFGNRENRKRARLKYLIEERGLDWFRGEVEKRYGKKTDPAKKITFKEMAKYHGWHQEKDDKWFLGLYVENGRVKNEGDFRLKEALRLVIETFKPRIFLTPDQDIILSGFSKEDKFKAESALRSYGVKFPEEVSKIRRESIACPAFPTCGLAISEAERAMPLILEGLEKALAKLGLEEETICIRATGCPNGCARPYNAEIAFVGRTAGTYNIYLGGSPIGDRLNKVYREKIGATDLAGELLPVFKRFKKEKEETERFGDYCHRVGIDNL